MKTTEIKVPEGIQYISEWGEYQLPKGHHCIVNKGVTGCGYTEFCLGNSDNVVLCSPRKLLLENKRDQHLGDPGILYLENEVTDFSSSKTMGSKVLDHWTNCKGPYGNIPCKIMVTYDSCHYAVETLKGLGLLREFVFVADEFQSIFSDAFFKSDVELDFVSVLRECPSVIYLSATPMLEKYLDRLSEFKDLPMYILDWKETGYVENVVLKRKNTNSLSKEAKLIIDNYKSGKFPMTLDPTTGQPVESKEAVFYLNSVSEILRIVSSKGLTPDNTIIICSDTPENQTKLKKKGFSVGKVPLKGESYPMFMLCTSTSYFGVDMYSDCASTYIFSDPNITSLATDIYTDLSQIVGRQRNKSNLFKNDVTIFYKTQKNPVTREDFDKLQEQRRKSTKDLLDLYSTASNTQKQEYIKKLKSDIQLRKYSDDFVAVSSLTNLPVYNTLIEISNERAWEVSQKDYQDNISVTRALKNAGFIFENYKSEYDEIVSDFLDNHFYKTGIFSEKMKMYCEFRDIYNNIPEVLTALIAKIPDQKFHQYYEYYGTKGCSSRCYKEIELYRGWKNITLESQLEEKIKNSFKIGEKYSIPDIKEILNRFNKELGISKKAKATDLENYFKLFRVRITLSDGKIIFGYRLDSL